MRDALAKPHGAWIGGRIPYIYEWGVRVGRARRHGVCMA
jgi:hypothetical protein